MKILTLHQAVEEIKKIDPNSDISTTMLSRLINEKKLPYGSRGNRTVIEWFILIASLNELLKFTGETFIPQIRTIRNAAIELKQMKSDLGISESHIRRYVEDKKLDLYLLVIDITLQCKVFRPLSALFLLSSLLFSYLNSKGLNQLLPNKLLTQPRF